MTEQWVTKDPVRLAVAETLIYVHLCGMLAKLGAA